MLPQSFVLTDYTFEILHIYSRGMSGKVCVWLTYVYVYAYAYVYSHVYVYVYVYAYAYVYVYVYG